MTGDLFIDNIDAYTQWGVSIQDGGYNGLIQYPPLKDIQFNDWPDEDGIDPDLSAPKLNIKTFNILFGSTSEQGRQYFLEYLAEGSYHVFNIPKLSFSRTLRCMNETALVSNGITNFTLQFVDDFPDNFVGSFSPISLGVPMRGYTMDSVDFSAYGIWVREGTDDSIERMPSVKPNLIRQNSVSDGALYNPTGVYYQAKDVVLRLTLKADDIPAFFNNYYAFFSNMVAPGTRWFTYPRSTRSYPFYYKNATVTDFTFGNGIWCDFNLTISFTTYRVGVIDFVLGTENENYIVTENNLLIDLNEN